MPTSEPKDKSGCLESFHPLDSDSTVQENHSHPKQTGLAKKDASPRGTMGGKDTPSVCSTLPYALSRMDNRNCGPSLTRSKPRLATVFMHPRRCREKVTLHFGVFCTTIPQPPLKHRDEATESTVTWSWGIFALPVCHLFSQSSLVPQVHQGTVHVLGGCTMFPFFSCLHPFSGFQKESQQPAASPFHSHLLCFPVTLVHILGCCKHLLGDTKVLWKINWYWKKESLRDLSSKYPANRKMPVERVFFLPLTFSSCHAVMLHASTTLFWPHVSVLHNFSLILLLAFSFFLFLLSGVIAPKISQSWMCNFTDLALEKLRKFK